MQLRHSNIKHTGFSTPEIWAIFGLVVIMVAILRPVFQRTDCDDRRASCQSKEKQLCLAFAEYTQDYDERLPLAYQDVNQNRQYDKGDIGWTASLQTYGLSWGLFECPSAPARLTNLMAAGFTNYAANANLLPSSHYGMPLSHLSSRSKTILLWESQPNIQAESDGQARGRYGDYEANQNTRHHHASGANFAFVDGHVKFYKPGTISGELMAKSDTKPSFGDDGL